MSPSQGPLSFLLEGPVEKIDKGWFSARSVPSKPGSPSDPLKMGYPKEIFNGSWRVQVPRTKKARPPSFLRLCALDPGVSGVASAPSAGRASSGRQPPALLLGGRGSH